ncbi:MAG: hypothetical protein J6S14_15045 [Clostridia bacterium]|nr:hypothetical protein [Clostridia bacterium]
MDREKKRKKVTTKAVKILRKRRKALQRKIEFSKVVMMIVLVNGMLMMWCSYVLAWFDKIAIAETLSATITDVIVGSVLGYLGTKTIENISKYGSRLNGTTKEQEQVIELEAPVEEEKVEEIE